MADPVTQTTEQAAPEGLPTSIPNEMDALDPMLQEVMGVSGFAAPVEDAAAPEGEAAPADEGAPTPNYWQSKYDKAQAEQKRIEAENAFYKQQLQQFSSGQPQVTPQPARAAQQGTSEDSLKRPVRPPKPANFDAVDSNTDPDSESWAYRESMEAYNDDVITYMENIQDQQVRAAEYQAEQEAIRTQANVWENQLRTSYGMADAEVQEFMTMMSDPELTTLPNLVAFYRTLTGKAAGPVRKPQPKLPLPPIPSATAQGAGTAAIDERGDTDKMWDFIKTGAANADPWMRGK